MLLQERSGGKKNLHSSVIAHSTSQLVVSLPGSQFLFPPGGQHTTSAPGNIFCLFLCAGIHPNPWITHLWLPSATRCFPPTLHRCKCMDRERLARLALTVAFFLPQTGSSLDMGQWLPSCHDLNDQLQFGTAGLGGERRHGTGLELDTHCVGETCSQKVPGRCPPESWFMSHCLTSLNDMLGG